jgi:serine/threonine-protein kinase HipA
LNARSLPKRLKVYLHQDQAGELEWRGPNRYRFRYADTVVAENRSESLVLSASLRVRAEPFTPSETRPFFEGLLPEGEVRQTIARQFGLSAENGYGLLAELGADCAGAVVVLPPEQEPAPPGGGRIEWLDDVELAQRIADLPRHPLGVDPEQGIRLSLGGVQTKLVLTRAPSGVFGRPTGGAPSTHLLKPGHEDYEDVVENECFCLQVARCSGLPTARSEILSVEGRPCLVVERFDRTIDDEGGISRLHQEDACQALGRLPSEKYEAEGGPSFAELVDLLRELGGPNTAVDINTVIRATVLNFLLGNADAHGKNFAFLYDPDVRLAPLYDIVSTSVYPELTSRLAMTIGGTDRPEDVDLPAWQRLADQSRLGGGLRRLVREHAERVVACARATHAASLAASWHRPVLDRILEVAERRFAQLETSD